ncbi:ribosome maturation factor RimM [Holospora curviuscula]|uniref:ribosome maturation factor RimM n=1 Tax=Holospora curviuscula TaxID=1082868 RepID=UPI000CE58B53|nr:ribosome maturation factor RimM [Holospora curviuscula]
MRVRFSLSALLGELMLLIAKVLGPKGIKGNLKVKVFTQDPLFITFCSVVMNIEKKIFHFYFVGSVGTPTIIEVRCRGVDSREKAELLKGVELYTLIEHLEPLPQDQYYWKELEGYKVFFQEAALGTVIRLENFGATDLLEIRPFALSSPSIYLPFHKDFVAHVCKIQRSIQCTEEGKAWIRDAS